MNHRIRRLLLATGVAATAVATLAGVRATAAPTANNADTIVTTTGNTSLSGTGGQPTTIIQIDLPPGAYVLHASGDLVNMGPSDFTRCFIMVNGTQVAAVATLVGDASPLASFALTGGANDATGGNVTVALTCAHDNSNGATPYVDAFASLWAHETTGLSVLSQAHLDLRYG
jgi:hypothetical protein